MPEIVRGAGTPYETREQVPEAGLPAAPWGLHMLQSRTFVGGVVAAVFGLVAAVLTLLRAFGIEPGVALAAVDQEGVTDAIVTIAGLVAGIAGAVAAQGRLNGGKALSPIVRKGETP